MDQLTQAEIDALRDAVRTGKVEDVAEQIASHPEEEIKVVSYDFRKPKLLSMERMVELQLMHQTFVKNVQGMLFTMFKVSGESRLAALEQVTYGEYVLSLAAPTYLIGMDVGPDLGPTGIEMSPPMGQILLDMLLGGDGVMAASEPPHEFSPFELEIMRTLTDRILEELEQCWKSIYDVTFRVSSQGISPEQVQIAPPDTPCLVALIDSRIDDTSVRMQMCYPFSTLQTLFEKAEADRADTTGRRAELRKQVLRAIQGVPLPVHIELGRARITAGELDNLMPGDIIKLDRRVGDPLKVNLGDRTIGRAHAGTHRGRMAASVSQMWQPVKQAGATAAPPTPAPVPPPAKPQPKK